MRTTGLILLFILLVLATIILSLSLIGIVVFTLEDSNFESYWFGFMKTVLSKI